MLLHVLYGKLLRSGHLTIVYPDGAIETYGDGTGRAVRLRLSRRGVVRIALDPSLGVGEAYMDGDLTLENGDLWDLLTLVGRNLPARHGRRPGPVRSLRNKIVRRIRQANSRAAARRNVAHHYDLSADLYRRFLDADMQYSCAYFPRPGMTLDEAQAAKKAHIAAKLDLRPGLRVLDIGCGWGGMALTLARDYEVEVTGITLSQEQLMIARRRAGDMGLADRARFELTDYRDVRGSFDRILSVGMFEHVGVPNYASFFEQVANLLAEDGAALIHSIGCKDPPGVSDPFIRKYIFPGGFIPSLSQVMPAIEPTGLWITDIEVLRLHYAETLRCWRERFAAERDAVSAVYDERFCRMWEFYLAISELSFRAGSCMNIQIQLAKRVDALPVVRTYMLERENSEPMTARTGRRQAAAI